MMQILLFTIFLVAVASEVLNDEVRKITFYLKQDLESLREIVAQISDPRSENYGKYFSYILSHENHESLFIPKGFAHGYLTLSETVLINYAVDNYYSPNNEVGISYNDKFLKIDWGVKNDRLIISEKDKKYEPFKW